jgi:hypothetical protein
VRPKVPFEKSQGPVQKKLPDARINTHLHLKLQKPIRILQARSLANYILKKFIKNTII